MTHFVQMRFDIRNTQHEQMYGLVINDTDDVCKNGLKLESLCKVFKLLKMVELYNRTPSLDCLCFVHARFD